jgi:hypothetical protein
MFTRRRDRDAAIEREAVVEREEHAWGSPPIVRGLFTLLGVAAAGFLVWLATQFDLGSTSEFWAAMGILAGAGAVLGLSQLLGGWTKWGAPTISPSVFLLGFLPTLVAVGGILVATRPTGTEEGEQVSGWIRDIGLGGLAEDLALFQGVLAFGLGIVFTFIFDTLGPRARVLDREAGREVVPDEDVHDYRREPSGTTVQEGETVPAGSDRDERTVATRRDTP